MIVDKTGTLTKGHPALTDVFSTAGYSEEDIGKINCMNLLRVLKAAEVVKKEMENELPCEALFENN